MFLHSDQEGYDCIWKLWCHCIQILHSEIYSAADAIWNGLGLRLLKVLTTREWRGEENFSLLYRARLLLLNSRIWGFLHLLLESRFLSLSLTLFLSFCQKNCVLRVWRSVLWRCYQFRFFWPMVIFWQTILLRFYALLLFWNYDRIMMTEKTHK